MASESVKTGDDQPAPHRGAGIDYYFENNRAFGWLVASGRYPLLRFGGILVAWWAVLWLVCYFEGALGLGNTYRFGRPASDFLEDAFTMACILTVFLAAIAVRRLLRHVEEFLTQFPRMLKPEPGVERQAVAAKLMEVRQAIALRTGSATRWHGRLCGVLVAWIVFFQVLGPFIGCFRNPAWSVRPGDYPWAFVAAVLWGGFWVCFVLTNLLWYTLATWFTIFPLVKRYAKADQLYLVPSDPDGQGGLAPIGAVAFGVTCALGTGTVLLVVWILCAGVDDFGAIVGGGAYVVFMIVCFFWPLWSTHEAMRRAKQAQLERIALLFRREYLRLHSTVELPPDDGPTDDGRSISGPVSTLADLESLNVAVKAMPVWPFDVATVRKLGFLIITPLVPAAAKVAWPMATVFLESLVDGLSK